MVKICLDAGHYGKYNRSPAVKAYYESDMAWKLHLLQKKFLEEYEDVTVITTREDQATDRGLYDRGAASKGCDLFISDHSNAVGSGVNESVDYAAVYHLVEDSTTDVDDISKRIAGELAPAIADVMGTKQGFRLVTRLAGGDRNGDGMVDDNYYGVLHGARMVNTPGMILEHSFHTNTKMARWLLDDNNLARLARAEVEVLAAHFGLKRKGAASTGPYTRISGKAAMMAGQMRGYILAVNPSVPRSVLGMIPLYLSEGAAEGIRGDIAFAQSCLETGDFTFSGSAVTLSQNNFCGMGVTSNGMKGNSFSSPQLGIRAQIQHLKAYADTDPLVNDCIDPRFKYVPRGSAEYVEWLGIQENPQGKGWATGAKYGEKILNILKKIAGAEPSGGSVPYKIRVKIDDLYIRKGAGTNYRTDGHTGKGIFTIVDEADGQINSSGKIGRWGLLKSHQKDRDGWICLALGDSVTEKV